MSKASVRASIESVKGDIARYKLDLANVRSRKKEASARYSANIKNAKDKSIKDSYRRQKASVIANYESDIRRYQSYLAERQSRLAQLRVQLKNEK